MTQQINNHTDICCETRNMAILKNHIKCLKQICNINKSLDNMAAYNAVINRNLEMLKFLHEAMGCPLDKTIYEAAGYTKYLPILKWLHENGCYWEECNCNISKEHEIYDCLYQLHEEKCNMSQYMFYCI